MTVLCSKMLYHRCSLWWSSFTSPKSPNGLFLVRWRAKPCLGQKRHPRSASSSKSSPASSSKSSPMVCVFVLPGGRRPSSSYPGVGWVLRWLIKPIFALKVLGQWGQGSAVGVMSFGSTACAGLSCCALALRCVQTP